MAPSWNKKPEGPSLPLPSFPPHKNRVPFKRYMSLADGINSTGQVNKFEARHNAPSDSFIEKDHYGPRWSWKMNEMWRKGCRSLKTDELTLHLTGGTGSVASFVWLDLIVKMTPEGGKIGLCSHRVDWEGLVCTDEIPGQTCHECCIARTWSHSGASKRLCVILEIKNLPDFMIYLVEVVLGWSNVLLFWW